MRSDEGIKALEELPKAAIPGHKRKSMSSS
jgi:hypothetical protein